ncbi:MAG: protein kinase [Planctomycetaceae bacterium]
MTHHHNDRSSKPDPKVRITTDLDPTVGGSPDAPDDNSTRIFDDTVDESDATTPDDAVKAIDSSTPTIVSPAPSPSPEETATFSSSASPADSRTHPEQDTDDTFPDSVLSKQPRAGSGRPDVGDYKLLGELGRGGMGVVYKAKHQKLNRVVALKMILGGQHANEAALARFITEAQAVAHLQHPSIVQIFDIGEHNNLPYFSLEYVEGCDLKQQLDAQPQDARYAATVVEQIATAMQYAHDNNILHRDLKPSNILLNEAGEPKITDFGLAKQVDDEAASTATSNGTIMGSPSYMPPEQARGEVSSLSPRSDLYSLGAILYEMLTGRPPFVAKKPIETVMQVVNNEPVAPREFQPDVPVDIETICLKAMQKEPSSRYQTCDELAADLRRFLNGEPILAKPVGRIERLLKWCRRNPKIALPSGLALLGIITTAIIATWAWQTTSAQAAVIAVERDNAQEQRDEAQKQKKIAEENQSAAETQARVALESIQFVVSEVDGQLRGKPQLNGVRIKLMDAVSDKWDEIDIDRAGGVLGEAIPTYMAVRFAVANAFAELDELEKAHREYQKLEKAARERIVVKGVTDATRDNLARILTAWALVRKRLPDQEKTVVVDMLTEAIELIDATFEFPKPVDKGPTTLQLRKTRAAAAQNLGTENLYQGNLAGATKAFQRSLDDNAVSLKEVREAPGFEEKSPNQKDGATAGLQLEHDRAALSLATTKLRRGGTDEAMKLFDKAIAGRREIFERHPGMAPLRDAFSGFLSINGRAHLWLNQPDKALVALKEAVEIQQKVYEQDPKVARNGRAAAETHFRLAVAYDLLDQKDQAQTSLQACHKIRTKLVAQSDDIKNRVSLMLVDARLGNVPNATKTAAEILADEDSSAEHYLDAARAFAQISRHVVNDEAKPAVTQKAIKSLERCVEQGYSEPFRIEHENDLEPLRTDAAFKNLLIRLRTG